MRVERDVSLCSYGVGSAERWRAMERKRCSIIAHFLYLYIRATAKCDHETVIKRTGRRLDNLCFFHVDDWLEKI